MREIKTRSDITSSAFSIFFKNFSLFLIPIALYMIAYATFLHLPLEILWRSNHEIGYMVYLGISIFIFFVLIGPVLALPYKIILDIEKGEKTSFEDYILWPFKNFLKLYRFFVFYFFKVALFPLLILGVGGLVNLGFAYNGYIDEGLMALGIFGLVFFIYLIYNIYRAIFSLLDYIESGFDISSLNKSIAKTKWKFWQTFINILLTAIVISVLTKITSLIFSIAYYPIITGGEYSFFEVKSFAKEFDKLEYFDFYTASKEMLIGMKSSLGFDGAGYVAEFLDTIYTILLMVAIYSTNIFMFKREESLETEEETKEA